MEPRSAGQRYYERMSELDFAFTSENAGGAVTLISFSRPPRNHFNAALIGRLADLLERADEDPAVRATVLASDGEHFCTGADLTGESQEPSELYRQALRLFAIRKPIVAALQGATIGGGLGLALVADFRVIAPSSRLAANFVKLGIHPGFALTYTLPRLVGQQRAAEILYTGRRLTAEEGLACGLADRIATEQELRQSAVELARQIAENAPLAVEATRATLRVGMVEQVRRQLDLEIERQLQLVATDDFAEGVRAVAERRAGHWLRR